MVIKMDQDKAKKVMKELNLHQKFKCELGGSKTEPHIEVFNKNNGVVFYSVELKLLQAIADVNEVSLFIHLTWDVKENKAVISAILH